MNVIDSGKLFNQLESWQDCLENNCSYQHISNNILNDSDMMSIKHYSSNSKINDRIFPMSGDITSVQVDAIVNVIDELPHDHSTLSCLLSDKITSTQKIFVQNQLKDCSVGEIKITDSFSLPCKLLFHIISPFIQSTKYESDQTDIENYLHFSYRNVLIKALELELLSIAIPIIQSKNAKYSSNVSAHIALKTIRKFLEQHYNRSKLNIVLFTDKFCNNFYDELLPFYFPRCLLKEELNDSNSSHSNKDLAITQKQQKIHIIDNPQHSTDITLLNDNSGSKSNIFKTNRISSKLENSYSQIQDDLDREHLLSGGSYINDLNTDVLLNQTEHQDNYENLLRKARSEDLTEISGIGCLYHCGYDHYERPVIVLVGKWFPFKKINLKKTVLYIILLLDKIVKEDYIVIYFHTLTSRTNYPTFTWLSDLYTTLPYKYKKNLKAFYIVHPTILTKITTWWFTTFMASSIKKKVHNITGLEYLYSFMNQNELEIPAFITEYDISINGINYLHRIDQ